jgi:hypothetical protein
LQNLYTRLNQKRYLADNRDFGGKKESVNQELATKTNEVAISVQTTFNPSLKLVIITITKKFNSKSITTSI